jgi:hypothetical protein
MFYPIKLDKERNLRYGMKAIDLIEKKFGKPVMQIQGMQDGNMTMDAYATVIWAGLVHEDPDLTPEKVMDLVDGFSSLPAVTVKMWEALNAAFGAGAEDVQKNGKQAAKAKNIA